MTPTVLFDLDGTLTDPKLGITRSINYALEQLGVPPRPESELLKCIGPPLLGSFQDLLGTTDATRCSQAMQHYRDRFSDVGLYENAVYPGIPEALARLQTAGYALILATSKPLTYAKRILTHFELDPYFAATYGSELDGRMSDKGELIYHILRAESLEPNKTLMVGDREHDIHGATKAGIRSLGVLYGYGSEDELRSAGATALCESPVGLELSILSLFCGPEN
jgi:phosphoglycolate phosphatase